MTEPIWAVPCPHCGAFYIEVALPAHIAWKHPRKASRARGPERIRVVLDRALRDVKRRAGK